MLGAIRRGAVDPKNAPVPASYVQDPEKHEDEGYEIPVIVRVDYEPGPDEMEV